MTSLVELLNWFDDKDKVLVSLSGGVDSALVAYAANKKLGKNAIAVTADYKTCLLYTSPSPRDPKTSRMPSSA